ncbi:hypothetical protein [Streptomyces sp. 2A115]|uniref:hypothetical protein n=1 Tax=Streptomyces sp. 2A115 TaxID=3457439 RepID=UPI003FD04CDD
MKVGGGVEDLHGLEPEPTTPEPGAQWSPTTDADFFRLGDSFGAAIAGDGTLASLLADAQKSTVDNLPAKGLKARSA